MRSDKERLLHILEAIERIEKYTIKGFDEFSRNELIQIWMIQHIQIIGEAARSLSPEFKEKHSEVKWTSIVGMRHVLVHEYFGIDLTIVWNVVSKDLPDLKQKIINLID